jgi:oligopeptide transport system permease protein
MIFLLVTISFFMVKMIPGSPFTSEKMQAGNKAAIYAYYGLDKPVYVQYFVYLKNLLKGDLGVSYKIRSISVNQIIADAFPYSLDLGLRAIAFALVAGLLLGIIAAYQRGKPMDTFTMILAIIGVREGHDISTGRAVLAIFLPVIIAIGLGILAAVLIPMLFGVIGFSRGMRV